MGGEVELAADLGAANHDIVDTRKDAVAEAVAGDTEVVLDGELHHGCAVRLKRLHHLVVRRPPREMLICRVNRLACEPVAVLIQAFCGDGCNFLGRGTSQQQTAYMWVREDTEMLSVRQSQDAER